jgi:DNA polymerase-3 subunit epsilon
MKDLEHGDRWWSQLSALDTETTGTNTAEDRIVTAAITSTGTGPRREWLIYPEVEIPEKATAVHGISTEHAQKHGWDARLVLTEISSMLQEITERGVPLVVFNTKFDLPILTAEFHRHGINNGAWPEIIDPLVIDKHVDRYRGGSRKLDAVCEHWGVELVNAHSSTGDAEAALLLAQAMFDRGVLNNSLVYEKKGEDGELCLFQVDGSSSSLQAAQAAWADQQSDSLRKFWRKKGNPLWKTVTNGWPFPRV